MSNIDKQAFQVSRYDLVSGYMQKWPDGEFVYHSDYQALLDELEAKDQRIAELPGQKRLIGWRMADYTDETADPALAKNWSTAVDVLPIFEGDVNTKLSAAAAGKGDAS
ncbi:hypothetical protein QA436_000127 [Escherichia coli]|nr:hypothetical protein [Escherichia coli]